MLFILLYSVLSGSFRKWIIDNSTFNMIITSLQIGIPWLLVWPLLKKPVQDQRQVSLLFTYIFALCFMAANPLNLTLLHGLSGVIIHSAFLIVFTFYFAFKDTIDFNQLIFWILLCGLLQTGLGAIQSFSPADSWINVYAGLGDDGVQEASAYVGDAVRVTGTFSYLSGFTSFLLSYLFLNCYLFRKHPDSIWVYIVTFSGLYGALISGARSAVGVYVATLLTFILLETKLPKKPQKLFAFGGFILLFLLLNLGLNDPIGVAEGFQTSLNNFMRRVEGNRDEGAARLYADLLDLFFRDFDYRFTGIGLGATYQGINQVMGQNPLLSNVYYEGELFRLMIEGGVLLVLFKFIIIGYILSKLHFSALFKFFLFILLGIYTSLTFNVYNVIFTAVGLMVLDQAYQENEKKSA